MTKDIESIFKPHLTPVEVYKGGRNPIDLNGQKVYKLSSNENPLGQSTIATQALINAATNISMYPDRTDIRLREALSKDFNEQITPNQFLCGNSGSELIDMILRAFITVGDEVIYSKPYFLPYSVFSRWYGAELVNVGLLEPNYDLDTEGILNAITSKTKVIFLTSPNNPTGTHIPKHVLDDFLKRIPKNIIIVFDEVYRHFANAPDYTSALPYVLKEHNIVAINSFSKTYGLAGQRVGYCYTTEKIAHYIRQIQKPFLLPITSIEAAIGALSDVDFVKKTIQTVNEGRSYLSKEFDRLNIKYCPSQGNFILITPPIPELEFTNILEKEGIMVRPTSSFGSIGKVRISIGIKEANESLIMALQNIIV